MGNVTLECSSEQSYHSVPSKLGCQNWDNETRTGRDESWPLALASRASLSRWSLTLVSRIGRLLTCSDARGEVGGVKGDVAIRPTEQ